jgi:hypothetical protein
VLQRRPRTRQADDVRLGIRRVRRDERREVCREPEEGENRQRGERGAIAPEARDDGAPGS